MRKEEAIHILDNLKPTNTKSSFDAYVVGKAITMAIKALEQEPIIDKIRAEINELEYLNIEDGSDGYDKYIEKYEVLKIINKYKAESEE